MQDVKTERKNKRQQNGNTRGVKETRLKSLKRAQWSDSDERWSSEVFAALGDHGDSTLQSRPCERRVPLAGHAGGKQS